MPAEHMSVRVYPEPHGALVLEFTISKTNM